MPFIGCDGLVFDEGQLLLQKRDDFRVWGQPGGGLEAGEDLLECVRREVLEETGVEVEPQALVAIHYRRWLGKDILVLTFECQPVGGTLRISTETVAVDYFALDALPEPMAPLQRERLQDCLDGRAGTQWATQQASRRAQLWHGLRLLLRALRNRIQRRPAWRPQSWRVGAFATIWDGADRVLLLQRRDMPAWNLPGGRVEEGESPWDACVREVEEETGLKVRVERLTGVYAKPHKDEVVLNFDCAVAGGELVPTSEASQARYYPLDLLPSTLLARQRERIHDAALRRPHPIVKRQGADWQPSPPIERRAG